MNNIFWKHSLNVSKNFVKTRWEKRAELFEVLRRCRISIIMVTLVVSVFLLIPQAQDVLCSIVQPTVGLHQIVVFEISLISWALIVWYGGRFLMNNDFDAIHRSKSYADFGISDFKELSSIGKICKAIDSNYSVKGKPKDSIKWLNKQLKKQTVYNELSQKVNPSTFNKKNSSEEFPSLKRLIRLVLEELYPDEIRQSRRKEIEPHRLWGEKFVPRLLSLLGTVGVGSAMIVAVEGINNVNEMLRLNLGVFNIFLGFGLFAFLVGRRKLCEYINNIIRLFSFYERKYRVVSRHELSFSLKLFIYAISTIAFGLLVWFYFDLQRTASLFGTAPILFLGCSILIVFATWVIYWGEYLQLPMIIIILFVVGIFNLYNDNHAVRPLNTKSMSKEDFFSAKELYIDWRKKMDAKYGTKMGHPMFIIAASGGGIKAAYWTASVLGTLQDQNESFAEHTIIISPVSGGTLGSLIFANLVAHGKEYPDKSYVENSQLILSKDFLAPALSALLFYDLPARFWPFPKNPIRDRAVALEEAWERNYSILRSGFSSILNSEKIHNIPTLLINGTSVETGKRILTTHLDLGINFPDCENIFDIPPYDHADIRMSTAVMMSARFPYISPAGTIDSNNHVVDGGYYDNSGAATALQFYECLEKDEKIKKDFDQRRVIPIYIQIGNPDEQKQEKISLWKKIFPGIQSPVNTLFNTISVHASDAVKKVKEKFLQEKRYTFSIPRDVRVPLSWFLSEESQRKLKIPFQDDKNVKANIEAIKTTLLPFISQTQYLPRIE